MILKEWCLVGETSKPSKIYSPCYSLNVCIPSKFTCWNPNAQGDSIRKWNLWGILGSWVWSLENRLIALIRLHRDPSPFHQVRMQEEGASYKHRRGSSLEYDHAGNLLLYFPVCRTMKNKCMLFMSYQDFVAAARAD